MMTICKNRMGICYRIETCANTDSTYVHIPRSNISTNNDRRTKTKSVIYSLKQNLLTPVDLRIFKLEEDGTIDNACVESPVPPFILTFLSLSCLSLALKLILE